MSSSEAMAPSRETLTPRPIDPGVRIGHVHLKVADLERALKFYCGVLGFELMQRRGREAAFISAGGVHSGRGASCSNFNEVPIKRAAMESADESILVVDDSKLGRLKPAFFSPLGAFSRVIVGGASARQRANAMGQRGAKAQPGGREERSGG